VTKTQSAGPISCLEHRATRVLHCAITRAAGLMFPLLLQTVISNQMRLRRLRGAVLSDSDVLNTNMILELFYVKQNIGDLTWFSKEEIDFTIKYCCISWFLFSSILSFYLLIFVYFVRFYIK